MLLKRNFYLPEIWLITYIFHWRPHLAHLVMKSPSYIPSPLLSLINRDLNVSDFSSTFYLFFSPIIEVGSAKMSSLLRFLRSFCFSSFLSFLSFESWFLEMSKSCMNFSCYSTDWLREIKLPYSCEQATHNFFKGLLSEGIFYSSLEFEGCDSTIFKAFSESKQPHDEAMKNFVIPLSYYELTAH